MDISLNFQPSHMKWRAVSLCPLIALVIYLCLSSLAPCLLGSLSPWFKEVKGGDRGLAK